MSRYTDSMIDKFKKTNLFYSNDFMKYQDPTYLGFKLFFLFDQPDSGLLSEDDLPNTALGYLLRRGETQRAEYLISFVRLFKRLNKEAPWFFQTIKGLDEAWKHGFQEDDFKSKIPKDRKITIECLDESIDLRITALMDLYRKACFDWENRREVVPKNLRYFQISIYVYEARSINRWGFPFRIMVSKDIESEVKRDIGNEVKSGYDKLLGPDPISSINNGTDPTGTPNPKDGEDETINPNVSRLMFRFSLCEFLPDESGVIAADISHKEMGLKAQQIVFSYGNVLEDNIYRMFSDKQVSDTFVSVLDILSSDAPSVTNPINDPNLLSGQENPPVRPLGVAGDAARQEINKRIKGLPKDLSAIQAEAKSRIESEVSSRVASRINSLFLGNVYGFSADTVISGASQGIGGLLSLAARIGANASLGNATGTVSGNIGFDESSSKSNDNGPDSTSQGTGNPNASLSNG